jgi:hypothetical protein
MDRKYDQLRPVFFAHEVDLSVARPALDRCDILVRGYGNAGLRIPGCGTLVEGGRVDALNVFAGTQIDEPRLYPLLEELVDVPICLEQAGGFQDLYPQSLRPIAFLEGLEEHRRA